MVELLLRSKRRSRRPGSAGSNPEASAPSDGAAPPAAARSPSAEIEGSDASNSDEDDVRLCRATLDRALRTVAYGCILLHTAAVTLPLPTVTYRYLPLQVRLCRAILDRALRYPREISFSAESSAEKLVLGLLQVLTTQGRYVLSHAVAVHTFTVTRPSHDRCRC